jgi:DNA-binding transcriptional MerR regulator
VHDSRATLTVAALARRVGLRPDTIRFYERIGLTQPPARTSGGHRRYDETAVDRLLFIQGMQRLGLRLADIRELLALRETGACPCEPAASLLRHRLQRIDTELARLTELRNELAAFVARIPAADCPEPSPGTWRPREEVPA